jgi:hypothetical protein
LATSNAGFSARVFPAFTVFNAGSGTKMWIMGGENSSLIADTDVWHSP